MTTIPNLAGVATQNLVEKIGGGNFQASYINWSRTMQLLREHAPGWEPHLVTTKDGDILWRAPVGGFLMICFTGEDGEPTEPVPQAVMDARNAAIPWEKITARDITDTHRRGICLAAAMTFGLAYELWAKLPLESGFHHEEPARVQPPPPPKAPPTPSKAEEWVKADTPGGYPSKESRIFTEELRSQPPPPKDSGEPTIGSMLTILNLQKDEALALFEANTGRKFLNVRDAAARLTPDEKVKVSAALKAEIALRASGQDVVQTW